MGHEYEVVEKRMKERRKTKRGKRKASRRNQWNVWTKK
jgi:hypothetical protein